MKYRRLAMESTVLKVKMYFYFTLYSELYIQSNSIRLSFPS